MNPLSGLPNHTRVIILFLLAFFLIAVPLTSYNLGKNQAKTTASSPTPTTDPTANWKNYKNTVYGYEIKYPPEWRASPPYYSETVFIPNEGGGGAPIGITTSKNKLEIELEKRKVELEQYGYFTWVESYKLNIINGKKLNFKIDNKTGYDFFAQNRGYTYHFVGTGTGKYSSIAESMLLTFKLTD